MQRLKLANIGCGNHSWASIQPGLVRVEEYDWVAACDLDPARLGRTADRFNVRPYSDFREMIAQEQPDVVLVIGPPAIHHEIGLAVLGLGCHLIVEKPPALSAAAARELVDAAHAAGRMGAVSTHWRHAPAHRRMKELMERPEFGRPTFYEGRFHAWGPQGPGRFPTTFQAYLFDQGVHLVDCTRFLMGDIREVFAWGHEGKDGAIGITVSLRFASGAVGQLAMASCSPALDHYTDVHGDGRQRLRVIQHDTLEASGVPPWLGQGGYADASTQTWRPGTTAGTMAAKSPYVEEHRHFAQALLAGEQPRASLTDGWQALRVLEAIAESLRTGGPAVPA